MARNGNGMQHSLLRMAEHEPKLAGKLLMTALPVWKAIRTEGSGGHATEGTEHRDD